MDAEDDVVLSDENLEGDCGSDFGDGDFPSEWTVLDDADEEGDVQADVEEMTVVEEVGEEDEEPVVEEKTKTPQKKPEKPEKKSEKPEKKPEKPEKKPDKPEKKPEKNEKKPEKPKEPEKRGSGTTTRSSKVSGSKDNPIEIDDSNFKDKQDNKSSSRSKPVSKPVEKKQVEKKTEIEDDLESIEGDMGDEDMETDVKKNDTKSSQSPARSSKATEKKDQPKTTLDPKKSSQPSKSSSSSSKSTTAKTEKTSTSDSSKKDTSKTETTSPKKETTSVNKEVADLKKEKPEVKSPAEVKKEASAVKKDESSVKKETTPVKKESTSAPKPSPSAKEDKKEEHGPGKKDQKNDAEKKPTTNGKSADGTKNGARSEKEQRKEKMKEMLAELFSNQTAKLLSERSNDLTAKLKLVLGDLELKDLDPLERSWDSIPMWHLKLSPIDSKDLALEGLKKVMNISQSAAYFFVGRGNKHEGHMTFLFNQYKDVQLIVNKLSCIAFAAKNISLSMIRKKSRKSIEEESAELTIVSNSAANLTLPVRGKEWIGEGKLKNRQLNINNVPVGTSREMLEVMFPYTIGVKFQNLKAKEKSGIATLECSSTAMARAVKRCYVSIKIGKNSVELSRVLEDKDEKDEKSTTDKSASAKASGTRDSSRQREHSRETSIHSSRESSRRNESRNDSRNGSRNDIASRSGRKTDAKISLRQEQAKKIRDRSRQFLQNQNRPAPMDVRRKQEQAMKQIQQRQMQIQQQQQMQMRKKMMMQQQMAQAVQQNQMALASFQAQAQAQVVQSQAKIAMMEGSGDGLLGPAPMMGGQNIHQQQGPMEAPGVPSHMQMMPGGNVNMIAQQEKERIQRSQLGNMDNMDVMGRRNMGQSQNQFSQRMEAERGEMFRQEQKLGNRMEPGFGQQQMNRNESLMNRNGSMMNRNESMHGRNEPMHGRSEPLLRNESVHGRNDQAVLRRNEPLLNQNEQMSRPVLRNDPTLSDVNRSSGTWSDRSPRASAPAIARMSSRSPARRQDSMYDQGPAQEQVQPERRRSDQWQEMREQDWGQDYPEERPSRKESFAAERRRDELDHSGQDQWRQDYEGQDYGYDIDREDSYSAGMKRPGQMSRMAEVIEKRPRMNQRSEYAGHDDNHQLQDMEWSKPDEMAEGRRQQHGYDDQPQRSQQSWGSGSLLPEPSSMDSGFKIHDYGHQSQGDDMWEDNRQTSRYEQGNASSLLPKRPAAPVGILRKGGQMQGGQQQMRQMQQKQQQQRQQNQQMQQQRQQQQRQQQQRQQQRQQQQRQQQRQQMQRQQQQQRQQNQRPQQQRQGQGQVQGQGQSQTGPVQRQQQAMMQHQMMQAAGRFQPKMVLLPTRLIPGMKRK